MVCEDTTLLSYMCIAHLVINSLCGFLNGMVVCVEW